MGKKGIASIFSKLVDSPGGGASSWPSCRGNPQTTSFRDDDGPCCCTSTTAGAGAAVEVGGGGGAAAAAGVGLIRRGAAGEMYKTVNSVYFDCAGDAWSCFGDEDEAGRGGGRGGGVDDDDDGDGFSTTTASEEWSEAVIRSLGRTSTDRFFFDPGLPASNSIFPARSPGESPTPTTEAAPVGVSSVSVSDSDDDRKKLPLPSTSLVEESVAVAVDSEDPYGDFRASMEEMVAALGLRGWDALEELLLWYLCINGKHNHALIVGAFVDLLVGLASSSPSAAATATTTTSTTTTATSTSSTTTTSSTSAGDAATATTTEQCGAGSGSPSSPSTSDQDADADDEEATVAGEEDDDPHIAVVEQPRLLIDLLHAN